MNLRVDYRFHSQPDRNERIPQSGPQKASAKATEPTGSEAAIAAVLSQNIAAAQSPLPDTAAAVKAAALLRSQIANQPATAVSVHQLTPGAVSSLLN